MSYSDKVQAVANIARDTAIANKIIDLMQDLKLKNDEKTASRWIWELIQNAKDVVGDKHTINIEVEFNEDDQYLSFKHDGRCFTTETIVFLISQVSSKERDKTLRSGVTGKFGTGFLTTHLLSDKAIIKAYLQDEEEPLKKIDILLDRSGKTKEEVIAAVNKSFRQLESSREVELSALDENGGFNTCFYYELDNKGIEIAKKGINSLYVSLPYVFAFVEKINSVMINNSYYVERGEISVSGNMETHTIYITENGEKRKICVLRYRGENIDLAIPVVISKEGTFIDEYPEHIPKLFCVFPLIGTEDFSFPVIINSSCFNPNDPRSGIYLTDVDSEAVNENKNLIRQALNSYKTLLDFVVSQEWKNIYNIVRVPSQPQKDWLSETWFNSIIKECKKYIKEANIIDTINGERKALYDWSGAQDVYIIKDRERTTREFVWEMAKSIYPEHMVPFLEVHKWYSSLWADCKNFDIQKFINKIEEMESLDTLEKKLDGKYNSIEWLNEFYEKLHLIQNIGNYESAKIYPNQLGQFCSISELYVDKDIEDIYKHILNLLDHECRGYLLNKEIQLPISLSYEVYDYDNLFEEILKSMNSSSFSEREAMAKIIVLYDEETKNADEQLDLLKLLKGLFRDQISDNYEVKKVNSDVVEKARNYWCVEMADKVSDCKNVEALSKDLKLSNEEDVWFWLKNMIEYLGKFKRRNLFERKTKPIIPNQNGDFITLENVFLDSGEIDDIFKDIMSEMGKDIREILLPVDIYLELPDSRVKGLKDVAQDVTEYVRQNQGISKNQDRTVRDNFNQLFCWINENLDKAKIYFKEIVENKHWLYNDEEIAQNIKKVEEYEDLLKKYNVQDARDLENVLKEYSQDNKEALYDEVEISEELMIQYGISSSEEFIKAKELNVFKENFVHISDSDQSKFDYVKRILERSKKAIFNHLRELSEYDVSEPIELTNTIFIVKKYNKEIALITRPSDYGQVILYYGAEKDILDFEKEYELWVEDGITPPQQITFGKMLKITGINRIPLGKVR